MFKHKNKSSLCNAGKSRFLQPSMIGSEIGHALLHPTASTAIQLAFWHLQTPIALLTLILNMRSRKLTYFPAHKGFSMLIIADPNSSAPTVSSLKIKQELRSSSVIFLNNSNCKFSTLLANSGSSCLAEFFSM